MESQKIQIIDSIKSLSLDSVTIDDIMDILSKLLDKHILLTCFTSDLILYRGIKYSQKPKFYKELIYPPVDKAKMNRASIKGEQLFYATTKKKAAFYELDAKPGDTFVITTWTIALPLLLSNIGYTSENLKDLGAFDETPLYNLTDAKDKLEIQPLNEQAVISNFLSKTFSQPIENENTYKLTIAISRTFMGDIALKKGSDLFEEFDGLLYPTIKYNANADNVVLKKSTIDYNKLSIDRVEFVKIKDLIDNKYQYSIVDFSDSINDDIIVWKNLSSTWTINDETDDIFFENNKAFNEFGDEVEPD